MTDALSRGRGDYKTYWRNRKGTPSDYVKPQTNDEHLILGTGKNILIIPKSLCVNCGKYFLTLSLPYHLNRCNV